MHSRFQSGLRRAQAELMRMFGGKGAGKKSRLDSVYFQGGADPMKPFWVYILRCRDGSYYTGHTDDLERRLAQHASGEIPSCYTFKRRPVKLVFSQTFSTREEALASERQIKGWSRKKKEAMMRGDWQEVSRLARSSTKKEEQQE